MRDIWQYEYACRASGYDSICGVDEAGRGALCGPVVAAAVVLPYDCAIDGIRDSKQLTPRQRQRLYYVITDMAVSYAVGIVPHDTIDGVNILGATLLAMDAAVGALWPAPDYCLIDGNRSHIQLPHNCITKGDNLSISIMAASVVAKVTRDHIMLAYDSLYPQYGLARHKGYPTPQHYAALAQYGASPIHRRTFRLTS